MLGSTKSGVQLRAPDLLDFLVQLIIQKNKTQKKRMVAWASNRLHFPGPSFDIPSFGLIFVVNEDQTGKKKKDTPKPCLLKKEKKRDREWKEKELCTR